MSRQPADAYRDAPGAQAVPPSELGALKPGECYEVRWQGDAPPSDGWASLGAHAVYRSTLVGRKVGEDS